MLDLVVVDGQARGIIVRNLITGEIERYAGARRPARHRRLRHRVLPVDQRGELERDRDLARATSAARFFANPCFTQIHPTCIPVSGEHQSKLTLMSESLRNDGRVWVPKKKGDKRPPQTDSRERARLLPRAPLPELRQPRAARRRVAHRQAGLRRGPRRRRDRACRCTSTSPTRSSGSGEDVIKERYGNLFEMYQKITDEDPYKVPMRIYPAIHYTMGGLWVDYNLMSTIPGLLRARRGELLRPRREPPRRQRADAGAGRRLLRHPVHARPTTSAGTPLPKVTTDHDAFNEADAQRAGAHRRGCWRSRARRTPREIHRELGTLLWDDVGMARNEAGLRNALARIPELREEFWQNVSVPGQRATT